MVGAISRIMPNIGRERSMAESLPTAWLCQECYEAVCIGLGTDEAESLAIPNYGADRCGVCGFTIGDYLMLTTDIVRSGALDPGDAETATKQVTHA